MVSQNKHHNNTQHTSLLLRPPPLVRPVIRAALVQILGPPRLRVSLDVQDVPQLLKHAPTQHGAIVLPVGHHCVHQSVVHLLPHPVFRPLHHAADVLGALRVQPACLRVPFDLLHVVSHLLHPGHALHVWELGAALEHRPQQPVGHELGPLILSHKQLSHQFHAVLPIPGEHALQRIMVVQAQGRLVEARGSQDAAQQPVLHQIGLRRVLQKRLAQQVLTVLTVLREDLHQSLLVQLSLGLLVAHLSLIFQSYPNRSGLACQKRHVPCSHARISGSMSTTRRF